MNEVEIKTVRHVTLLVAKMSQGLHILQQMFQMFEQVFSKKVKDIFEACHRDY